MHYYKTDKLTAKTLSRETFKLFLPEPLDYRKRIRYAINYFPHPIQPEVFGWCLAFPNNTYRPIHWMTKVIIETKGKYRNLSNSNKLRINEELKDFDFSSYRTPDGKKPYSDINDLFVSMTNYWNTISKLYPDEKQREEVLSLLSSEEYISLESIIPNWIPKLTPEEVFINKWTNVNLNSLDKDKLMSNRFPYMTEESASEIIQYKPFFSLQNLKEKTNISQVVKDGIEEDLKKGVLNITNN